MSEIGKSSPDPTCLVMIMFCTVSTVACIFCMFQIYLHVHWCWAANITGSFGSICKEFLRRLRSLIFCQHDIGNICPPCPGSRSCQDQTWNDQMEPVTSTTSTTSVYDILGTSQKSLPPWFPPIHRNKLSPTSGTNSPPLFLPDPAKPWHTRTRQIKEQKIQNELWIVVK